MTHDWFVRENSCIGQWIVLVLAIYYYLQGKKDEDAISTPIVLYL